MFSIHNLKEILTGFQETNQRLVHLANNVIDNPIHLLLQKKLLLYKKNNPKKTAVCRTHLTQEPK